MRYRLPVMIVTSLAALSLVVLIIFSSLEMSLAAGLKAVIETGWGITTLADLYAGLILVCAWICVVERSVVRAAPWIVGVLLLGNLTTLILVFVRAVRSDSLAEFLLGRSR